MIGNIFYEMRCKQYCKNFFVFVSPLFAGNLLHTDVAISAFLSFVAFCCASSAVYIVNDIADREKDRQHPVKCHRPIASGALSVPMAVTCCIVLLAVALGISAYVRFELLLVVILYLVMNLAYSFRLKHIVIVDVLIIAFGFVLRAFAGVAATGVGVTSWFILCIFTLSLFLALAKRRAELELLRHEKGRQRKVLKNYSLVFLDQIMAVVCAIMLTSYALFAQSASMVSGGGHSFGMLFTLPLVMYGVFRYMLLMYMRGLGEKPEDVLIHDKHICGTVVLYVICIVLMRNI